MKEKIELIVRWLQDRYEGKRAVIAVSGGVDSAVVLTLLTRAIGVERVTPILLPYHEQDMEDASLICQFNGYERFEEVNIGEIVELMAKHLGVMGGVRKGNLMARVRMIVVFDYAKKMGAMVCGTENKSEHMLGYYTRFGDGASDVEPIIHLYKTEVWEMAKELGIPQVFYTKEPSAGLWDGQTDENEMGFTYQEADLILHGRENEVMKEVAIKVREMIEQNRFKLEVPYVFE